MVIGDDKVDGVVNEDDVGPKNFVAENVPGTPLIGISLLSKQISVDC
jgi:hypothetical protein